MEGKGRYPLWGLGTEFFLLLVLDLWTKFLALKHLQLGRPVVVIDNLFNFTLVMNPGAAFGMFATLPDELRRGALLTVSAVALFVVFRLLTVDARDDVPAQFALVAILAGALGNMVDRVRYDAVVDFLDFYWGSYHWPAFNIADSAISVGVVVLMFRMFFSPIFAKQSQNGN